MEYLCQGTVKYNGITYKHGEAFPDSAGPAVIADLRRAGALKTASEMLPPTSTQAMLEEATLEIVSLKHQIETLTGELAILRAVKSAPSPKEKVEKGE